VSVLELSAEKENAAWCWRTCGDGRKHNRYGARLDCHLSKGSISLRRESSQFLLSEVSPHGFTRGDSLLYNPHDSQRFLQELYAGAEDQLVYILEVGAQGEHQHFFTIDQAIAYCEHIPSEANVFVAMYARKRASGKGNVATDVGAVWADFDNMGMPEVKARIRDAGLPNPSVLVLSGGHGIHAYWLLTRRLRKQPLVMVRAIAAKTGADSRVRDMARVMRLPGSVNLKASPVLCEIIEATWARYESAALMMALGQGDTSTEAGAFIQEIRDSRRPCIRAIAGGVPEGDRNTMLGRLVKDLQQRGYNDRERAWGIVVRWNRLNKPPQAEAELRTSFEAYWRNDYKLLGCMLDNPDLQATLERYCTHEDCELRRRGVVGGYQFDPMTTFNNAVLNRISRYSGRDLIVLGLLTDYEQGMTRKRLLKRLRSSVTGKQCMGSDALNTSLRKLQRDGWIRMTQGKKQAGEHDLFVVTSHDYAQGFTLVTNGAIDRVIDGAVSPRAFRVYVLLLRYGFAKGEAYPSIYTMAKDLGIPAQVVSNYITELEQAHFIERIPGAFEHNPDKLLYRFRM
jgi:hypothetical protein